MNQLIEKVILVTGANGFIGAHLVKRLSELTDAKVLLLSRRRQQSRGNLVCVQRELGQLSKKYWCDMGAPKIDYVFHLGAFTPKIPSEANRMEQIVGDNIVGTLALLQSLPVKPEKLVFASTLDVYGQPNDEVLTESSNVAPSTLYGESKLFCEGLVSAWGKEEGCDYAILRYGHIYGPGEDKYGKLIPTVIRSLLANRAPTVYGDGSVLRDYLYVGDAVEATLRAALAPGIIGPINVVRGESVALRDIVQLLIRFVGSDLHINFLTEKPNGTSLRFDNDLMIKSLGQWSMTGLEEGLAAEVEAFRRISNDG